MLRQGFLNFLTPCPPWPICELSRPLRGYTYTFSDYQTLRTHLFPNIIKNMYLFKSNNSINVKDVTVSFQQVFSHFHPVLRPTYNILTPPSLRTPVLRTQPIFLKTCRVTIEQVNMLNMSQTSQRSYSMPKYKRQQSMLYLQTILQAITSYNNEQTDKYRNCFQQ